MTKNEILTGADMIAHCLADSIPVAAPAPVTLAYGRCENASISTGERCAELVMLLGVSDVNSAGHPNMLLCQACAAGTAAFIARCEVGFIEANAWNPDYLPELRERQADAARLTRERNLADARRRFARLSTVR